VIGADFHFGLEFIEEGDFAVAGGGADDGVNFSGAFVFEFRAVDAIGRQDSFECRLDYFDGGGAENVKIEVLALDAVVENFVEQADIGFEADLFSDLN
jgi:hypothetical protein